MELSAEVLDSFLDVSEEVVMSHDLDEPEAGPSDKPVMTSTPIKAKRNHSCPDCGKSYRSRSYVTDHMRQKHDYRDGARYKCHICSKPFMKVNDFQSHLNTHAG